MRVRTCGPSSSASLVLYGVYKIYRVYLSSRSGSIFLLLRFFLVCSSGLRVRGVWVCTVRIVNNIYTTGPVQPASTSWTSTSINSLVQLKPDSRHMISLYFILQAPYGREASVHPDLLLASFHRAGTESRVCSFQS